jgi:hypothetical protein
LEPGVIRRRQRLVLEFEQEICRISC